MSESPYLPRRRRAIGALFFAVALSSCMPRGAVAPPPEPGVDPLSAGSAGIARSSASALAAGTGARLPAGVVPSSADPLVDDVSAAFARLEAERARALTDTALPPAVRVRVLTRLGLWDEAGRIAADERLTERAAPALVAAEAELLRKRHRYVDAGRLVDDALAAAPNDRDLQLAHALLQIDAWRLDSARAVARRLNAERADDVDVLTVLGRVELLAQRWDPALAIAQRLQQLAPRAAAGYLLEADVRFWQEDLTGAEAPLVAALERDPFDPDARFAYGYAIWRRVDARQLDMMAGQWSLALAVDPLHYFTHWHWGNGHTNLTYADYAHPTDSVVRLRLERADSLIARDRPLDAVRYTRRVEREFPESVLPAMLRGSAFYMAYAMDREARLDSAQATFAAILGRKRNYGPAHNGLAAVIKQRQFTVLAAYDSLERVIAGTPLPPDAAFDSVFRDVRYYPGTRVRQMVRAQLGPSIAYLPLLAKQDRRFRVPPLHQDLAAAMERPFFRGATTFDNRQWMDIRGVGSGAAGIEYVERGSFWERNVLNHEYVHLFHGRAFTDEENRRVRQLYWNAMRDGRTLDYYAANNEHEFLAQAYEAYISPVKAHPLNHKAMNTRADLERKDPATFAFIDSLARRQDAYVAGDRSVFASNWAQVYAYLADSLRSLHLSDSARGARAADSVRVATLSGRAQRVLADSIARGARELARGRVQAAALLDTALVWDPRYVPAMLSYAALRREERDWASAAEWLDRAQATDPSHAPVYSARAAFVARRAEAESGSAGSDVAFGEQAQLLERALALETDLAIRANLNAQLRGLYLRHGRAGDAVRVSESYVRDAPTVSTYLRDQRDDAAAFAAWVRSQVGYATESLVFFDSLVPRKPQNWGLRAQYAQALWAAGRADAALATLDSAQRILRAGAGASGGFAATIAEIRVATGDTAGARREIDALLSNTVRPASNDRRIVRVLALLGHPDSAARRHASYRDQITGPSDRAEVAYTRGVIAEARGDFAAAEREYRTALRENPYHRQVRLRFVSMLGRTGRGADSVALLSEARQLSLPFGPDFWREVEGVGTGQSKP